MPTYSGIKSFYEGHSNFLRPRLQEASQAVNTDFFEFIYGGVRDIVGIKPQLFFYAFSGAMFEELKGKVVPKFLTGYSMGMFTSLFAAEAIGFVDGLKMLEGIDALAFKAVGGESYSMVAVLGLDEYEIASCMEHAGAKVNIINQNSEQSFVIAGESHEVDIFTVECGERGAMVSGLPILLPYHTPAMSAIEVEWDAFLSKYIFRRPNIPIICSISHEIVSDAEGCKKIALSNISTPFSWFKTIKKMEMMGICEFIECGPSLTLSKLGKFINSTHRYRNVKNIAL